MARLIKQITFVLLLGLMVIPAAQSWMNIVEEPPLNGAFEEYIAPALSREAWLSGEYQQELDPYIENNIGFHNTLLRLNNQVNYSLFQEVAAEGVVRGKGGQLYEYDYIRAWMGLDFVGEKMLDYKLRRFRRLQDILKDSLNIDLVLVLEPGKASVYPEDIPEKFVDAKEEQNNYRYITQRSKELDINLIDFNKYYIMIRDTIDYPLFPKHGTHWSEFAMWYAADSLIRYIETIRGVDLPEVVRDSTPLSDLLQSSDYDIGRALNLFFELDHSAMPYPSVHFVEDSNHQKAKVLSVADSYYWNFYNSGVTQNLFSDHRFWYFNTLVYPDSYYGNTNVKDLDLQTEVEKQEVILLMMTERFFNMFDRHFIDDLYTLYEKNTTIDRLTWLKTSITLTEPWFNQVIEKAEKNGQTLSERLQLEAEYLLLIQDPFAYHSYFGPEAYVRNIKSNQEWHNVIKEQAAQNNRDVKEVMLNMARQYLNDNYPEALARYDSIQSIQAWIKTDSAWHGRVMKQAETLYLTEEEMLLVEAERVLDGGD